MARNGLGPMQTSGDWMKNVVKRHIFAFTGFAAVVLLVNWPLVFRLRTHVVGRSFDDVFEVLWQLSWMQTAVFEQRVNPFYAPGVFYPFGWYTASGAQPSWFLLLLSPLTKVLGIVATYNLTLLATFILAGFGVYLFAYRLTRQRLASFLAGCAYITAPVLTLRLGGHFHILLGMMFLPYALAAFYQAFTGRERSRFWLLSSGLALGLTILSMWYFLFIATLPIAGMALFVNSSITWRERLLRLGFTGAVTLVIIAPFAGLTWYARQQMFPGNGNFPLAGTDSLGISLRYLLAPNFGHPLWGDWSMLQFPVQGEQNVISTGYTTLALAIVGIVSLSWREKRPFLIMGIISLILAMGPILQWNNSRVLITVPPIIAAAVQKLYVGFNLPPGKIAVPLPGLLLYHLLPFYAAIRVWARFTIPFMLVLALFAGYGAAWLLNKNRRWQYALIVAVTLILFEGLIAPYDNITAVSQNDRAVNQWLAGLPPDSALMEYPYYVGKMAMYSQAQHGQPVVNGYMSIEPTHLQEVSAQLGQWPNAAALSVLRDWDVQYILVSSNTQDAEFQEIIWPQINALDGLCYVQTFNDGFMHFNQTHVFKLLAESETCPE